MCGNVSAGDVLSWLETHGRGCMGMAVEGTQEAAP